MDMSQFRTVVTVSTNIGMGCPMCGQQIGLERFDESVRHLIEDHNYVLLHAGSETTRDDSGSPWHSSVAILGSTETPQKREVSFALGPS
jgi:hypothetical protein